MNDHLYLRGFVPSCENLSSQRIASQETTNGSFRLVAQQTCASGARVPRRRARKGFTLIEVLAVLTVFSVTFGTVMFTLHAMFRANVALRDRIEYGVQIERLASQLRLDAHEATAATTTGAENADRKGTVLELSFGDRRLIRYVLRPETVERLISVEDVVQHRESYRLRPVLEKGWDIDINRATPLVSVPIKQQPGVGDGQHHALESIHIRAAVRINRAARLHSAP